MASLRDIDVDISIVGRANSEYDVEHWFDSMLDQVGLNYQAQHRLVRGKPDCLIGDIIIDFKFHITPNQLNKWVSVKGKQYINEYFDTHGKNPGLLIVVSESIIYYYDRDAILRDKRDISRKSILSLLECLLEPTSIDSDQFAILFGINSPLYVLSYARLEKRFDEHNGENTPCFYEWKKHFRLAYHDDDVGKILFLRHSYLSLLLKLIMYKEFINPDEYTREYFRDLENYFEKKNISLCRYKNLILYI